MPKSQPTNADILKEVRSMNNRIAALEQWKQGTEIARAAVEEYKKEEQSIRDSRQRREIMKQVGVVLSLMAAILYVYLESRRVKS